ncbi:MAG: tRNA (adenosine(37)-N6)-threonylcarbamoyltransferase complex dimerization subunit type 1 TsaB [Granulosicoccus sp.]
MKLLAIDTSTDACSVAICIDDQIVSDHRVVSQQHGALLLPMVDALMSQAGLVASQLDALIFGCGPGSFTGVRIGVATAQGIALGADIGVVGISTLQSIAQGCYREHKDCSVAISVDARMEEVYFCEYELQDDGIMQPISSEQIAAPVNVGRPCATVWAGSGAERYQDILQGQFAVQPAQIRKACLPQAIDLLSLGAVGVARGLSIAAERASPVYLRNKVALTTAERAVQAQ